MGTTLSSNVAGSVQANKSASNPANETEIASNAKKGGKWARRRQLNVDKSFPYCLAPGFRKIHQRQNREQSKYAKYHHLGDAERIRVHKPISQMPDSANSTPTNE